MRLSQEPHTRTFQRRFLQHLRTGVYRPVPVAVVQAAAEGTGLHQEQAAELAVPARSPEEGTAAVPVAEPAAGLHAPPSMPQRC